MSNKTVKIESSTLVAYLRNADGSEYGFVYLHGQKEYPKAILFGNEVFVEDGLVAGMKFYRKFVNVYRTVTVNHQA